AGDGEGVGDAGHGSGGGVGGELADGLVFRLGDVEEEREAEQVEHVEDARLERGDLEVAAGLADGLDVGHEDAEAGRGDVLEVPAADDDAGLAVVEALLEGGLELAGRVRVELAVEVEHADGRGAVAVAEGDGEVAHGRLVRRRRGGWSRGGPRRRRGRWRPGRPPRRT